MSITENDLQQRIGQQDALRHDDDQQSNQGSLSIGSSNYVVRPSDAHQIDINSDLVLDDRDGAEHASAAQQQDEIQFSNLNFDTKKVSKGWRVLTTPLAFLKSVAVGAAVGAGGGAIAGTAVGAFGGSAAGGTTGAIAGALVGGVGAVPGAIGGAAAGGIAGAGSGAGIGAIAGTGLGMAAGAGWGLASAAREAWTGDLADQLVAGGGWKSQGAHGQRAVASLNRAGLFEDADFRREAQHNLGQVSDREWRRLLHVPTHYRTTSWFHAIKGKFKSTEPRIREASDRQKIREAVMLYVAKHGKAGAAQYRARLLKVGSENPAALQTEINKLKAGVLAQQVEATSDHAQLNKIIQRNPDVFIHPQSNAGLGTDAGYNALGDFRGFQAIFGVADRLDTQAQVTQADRDELLHAFKTAGVANPPDILRRHVGKPMTPAIRHEIVEAFRDNMIMGQKLFNVSQDAGDNMQERRRIVDDIAAKGYDNATTDEERDLRSKQELQVLKDVVNDYYRLEFDNGDASTKARIGSHLKALDHGFETPAQRSHRVQEQGQMPRAQGGPAESPEQTKARFQRLFNEFAPASDHAAAGDAFEELQHQIGLTDRELNSNKPLQTGLRRAIAARFMSRWGNEGQDLPPDGAANAELRRQMEQEALIAIRNYFDRNPDGLEANRASRLKDEANQALQDCAASKIDRAKASYTLDQSTFNPAPNQINANNGRNLAAILDRFKLRKTDLPTDIQQKINDRISDQVTQNKTPAEIDEAVSHLVANEALKVADSDHASFAQQQRAVYAGTRHAASRQDNPGVFLRDAQELTVNINKIMDRHGGNYWGNTLSEQKQLIYRGAPCSYNPADLDAMQPEEFEPRKNQAIGNLRSTMRRIIGSKQNDDARTNAIQRVPEKTRQLLASIHQGARDGGGDEHARSAVLNGFVLRSLMPGLTAAGDRAKRLGVWDQGRQHSLAHTASQDSLNYTAKLANGVFTGSQKSLKVPEDGLLDRSKPPVANPLIQEIEDERAAWVDSAAQFLDQLVQSGNALSNPQPRAQNG